MNRPVYKLLPRLSLLAALLAKSAVAQAPPNNTRGPMAAFAQAISLPGMGGGIYFKMGGDQSSPPFALPPDLVVPDYNLQSMFSQISTVDGRALYSLIDIDAMSSGNDKIPVNTNNEVDPNLLGGWVAMALSVSPGSVGQVGSPVRSRSITSTGASADSFSFFFDGSGPVIGPALDGETMLEQTAQHMGFDATTPLDIDASDFFLPVIIMNPSQIGGPFLTQFREFYFSVTPASAVEINLSFPGLFGAPLHAADILRMDWLAGLNEWSDPVMYRSGAQLGLSTAPAQDNVNALMYDSQTNTLIFSTDEPSQPRFLVQRNLAVGSQPLLRLGGDSIPEGIKIQGSDDIDALCGFDPHNGHFSAWFASPGSLAPPGQEFGLSITRTISLSGPGPDRALLLVSGFGDLRPDDGVLEFEFWDGASWRFLWAEYREQSAFTHPSSQPLPPLPIGAGLDVTVRAVFRSAFGTSSS
ncbi:MAG: hypothetical protein VYE77_00010 [Planctomycetota bacterium]|nr:hypothetical protein [Planctomycetota bacterium]